jgi:predicted membrane protein
MYSDINEIFDKEIFTTKKKPFYFYLTVSLWSILFILFLIVIKIRELDKDSTIATAFIFLFFAIYIYVLFGRYLASITFYDHKIEVKYLFPWNKKIEFRFDKLTEIEFKEFDLVDRLTRSWYRGGKYLYLKNEIDEGCQFKYTINVLENEKLLKELQKRCSSDVVCR